MRYLLSWFCEYEDGKTERKAKVFEGEKAARDYIRDNNFEDDENILDYDIYVSINELNYANSKIEKLKRKINAAINKLSD